MSANLEGVLRECRMSVCHACYTSGRPAALAALAAASVRLAFHVESGSLIPRVAGDMLEDVAENLGLTRTFGRRAIKIAIDVGPIFYDTLDDIGADTVVHLPEPERAAA